ncbi:hypothetical protein CSPX01_04538, partial [Colletotrichum filicis]
EYGYHCLFARLKTPLTFILDEVVGLHLLAYPLQLQSIDHTSAHPLASTSRLRFHKRHIKLQESVAKILAPCAAPGRPKSAECGSISEFISGSLTTCLTALMTPFPNKETKTVQTRLHPQPIQPCKYTTRQACKPPAPTHRFAPPPNNLRGSYHGGYPDSKAFPSRTVKVPGLQLMAAFSSASDLRPIPRCSGSAAAVRQGDTNPLILIAPTDEQGSEKAISCSTLREACANRSEYLIIKES